MLISELPEDIREKANRYKMLYKYEGNRREHENTINNAFHWSRTPEGHAYWAKLCEAKKLPKEYMIRKEKKLYKIWN